MTTGAAIARFPKLRLVDKNPHGPEEAVRIDFAAFRAVKRQR
jgi:hypothetical protein